MIRTLGAGLLVLSLFGVGFGIGSAWRQGQLPISLLPAPAGRLSTTQTGAPGTPDPVADLLAASSPGDVSPSPFPPSPYPPAKEFPATEFPSPANPDQPELPLVRSADGSGSESFLLPLKDNRRRPLSLPTDLDALPESQPEYQPDSAVQPLPPSRLPPSRLPGGGPRPAPALPLREARVFQSAPNGVEPATFQAPTDSPAAATTEATPAPQPAPQLAAPPEPAATGGKLPSVNDLLAQAEDLLAKQKFAPALKVYSQVYWDHPNERPRFQETIDRVAELVFLKPQPHIIEPYVVQPGDRFEKIAARYKLSWQYLSRVNQTEPRRLRVDQRLKVVRGPFAALVDLHAFSLTVHLQGYYVKRFAVGIGKEGSSPIGKFPVLAKLENPQYTDPSGNVIEADDPQNPIGERWIDLGNSYGIHGTIDPDSIGKAASRGCIRLLDRDVIEVYDFLVTGSEVVIRP